MNKQIETMEYIRHTIDVWVVQHTPPTVRSVDMLVPLKQNNIDKQTQKKTIWTVCQLKVNDSGILMWCVAVCLNLNKNHMNYMTNAQYRNWLSAV